LVDTVPETQKSILIVEDDLDQARLYRKHFENHGFQVACFLNPFDALENFKLDVNFYTLVLTDFRLKDMNGIKFAKEIRRIRGYSIIIILMTGYFIDHSLR
jgi:DNA-binding NtrC family response regulator